MTAKYFFLFISFSSILFSCNNSAQTQNGQIDTVEIPNPSSYQVKQIPDSLTLIEQEKAINEIKFGISEKTFGKAKDQFLKKTALKESEFYKRVTVFYNKIGDYGFNSIYGLFHNDSLYFIEIQGCLIQYDEYNIGMPGQYEALTSLLRTKYGVPKNNYGFPAWTEIEKGYFRRCEVWEIGNKTLEVRISCKGVDYTLNLATFKPEIVNKVEQEDKIKLETSTKKGVDNL